MPLFNFGSAASKNVGTSAGNVVALDGSSKLPAVDGSQLTNVSGGGSPIVTPSIAYITSAGDDSTGDGSMAKPYLTIQKAYDDTGFTHFNLGAGLNAGALDLHGFGPVVLYISGQSTSSIGAITNHGFEVQIVDLGYRSFTIASIDTSANGAGNGGSIYLYGAVSIIGALNAAGGSGSGSGGAIGLFGPSSVGGSITTNGGNADVDSGANGGPAGSVSVTSGAITGNTISAQGGSGDGAGSPGADGTVLVSFANIGNPPSAGTLTVQCAVISNVFYGNTYPGTNNTFTPATSISIVGDTVSAIS
jgi:hypothetical protein